MKDTNLSSQESLESCLLAFLLSLFLPSHSEGPQRAVLLPSCCRVLSCAKDVAMGFNQLSVWYLLFRLLSVLGFTFCPNTS